MRCILILAAVAALATARPDTYRENEDFKYSRQSTDEGSKAGFYEAQRGNVGGNYERAHNMDSLAQHHMSGLVRQVDGEMGDAKDAPLGHLYAAGSSHGVYGSGHYDLSNLEGRNFADGESYGSGSHSSLAAAHNAGYGSHSSGYTSSSHQQKYHTSGSGLGSQALVVGQLQTVGTGGGYEYGKESSEHSHKEYHSGNRITGSRPAKIIYRPAAIHVPIAAQVVDASQSSSFDQNSINSQTELLENTGVVTSFQPIQPVVRDHGWESSSQYRKEWERHHAQPTSASLVVLPSVVVPSPYHQNHELYEDHQSKSQYHSSNSQFANSGAYQSGLYGANLVEAATPKSYQSQYSYHKSWERQGEPYVIQPVSGQLNTGSYSSHHQDSQSHHSFTQEGGKTDCVTLCY